MSYWTEDEFDAPTYRLHVALGDRRRLRPGERLIDLDPAERDGDLTEEELDVRDLDQDRLVRGYLERRPGLTAEVEVATRAEAGRLAAVGRPAGEPSGYRFLLNLDRQGLDALFATDPEEVLVRDSAGAPYLVLYKTWDTIFIYE